MVEIHRPGTRRSSPRPSALRVARRAEPRPNWTALDAHQREPRAAGERAVALEHDEEDRGPRDGSGRGVRDFVERLVDRAHGRAVYVTAPSFGEPDEPGGHLGLCSGECSTSAATRRSFSPTIKARAKVSIVPARGAIATSFRVGERELLYLDETTLRDPTKSVRGGIPILFPSPGKLEGDRFARGAFHGAMKQHGFARDLPWQVTATSHRRRRRRGDPHARVERWDACCVPVGLPSRPHLLAGADAASSGGERHQYGGRTVAPSRSGSTPTSTSPTRQAPASPRAPPGPSTT